MLVAMKGDGCLCTGGAMRTSKAQTSHLRNVVSVSPTAHHHCASLTVVPVSYVFKMCVSLDSAPSPCS